MTKPQQIIEFMNFAEGLKREMRHSYLSNGKQESVAEHCWSMSLLAMMLFDEVEHKVDQLKVLKMIVIHDLVEVIAGDIPSFESAKGNNQAKKEAAEQKALEQTVQKLHSKELAKEIKDLWYEFEAKETMEAKFAQACDKADCVIQHNNGKIEDYDQNDYDFHPYYKDDLFNFDKFIREFKNQLNADTMNKIEKEGDINRVGEEHRKQWLKNNQ